MRRVLTLFCALFFMPNIASALDGPIARFGWVTSRGEDPVERAFPVQAGQFRNPILPGFRPDPSITRVGNDYYLVTSTFAWFPGIPVYHSKDLVNWRQIGNAIDRPSQLDFSGLGVIQGVFAPTITHHAGVYYILNTCVGCGENFLLTANDPAGPWSDPIWLPFEGIDPSLFVDEDGRAWILNNGVPIGGSRYQGHRAIWIQEFDLKARQLIGPRSVLVDGGVDPKTKPIWIEGPHLYKVDGWYYLVPAEGGTAEDHAQTVYRARHITGPFTPGPVNPILTQRDLPAGRPWPVEATGHADLVQRPEGDWWAVFLGTRPYDGQLTNLGRETFLLPVSWQNGWPLVLPQGVPVPHVLPAPSGAQQTPLPEAWRETFDSAALGPEWIMLRTPRAERWWSLTDEAGTLRMAARADAPGGTGQPSFVGRRLTRHHETIETEVQFSPERAGDHAGLLALVDENHFLALVLERQADGRDAVVLRQRRAADQDSVGVVIAQSPAPAGQTLRLQLSFRGARLDAAYATGETGAWRSLARDVDASILATVNAGLFTGTVVGPYAGRDAEKP